MSEDHKKKIADTDLENVSGGQDGSATPAGIAHGEPGMPDPNNPSSTLDPNAIDKSK